jgi:hypothetical protein
VDACPYKGQNVFRNHGPGDQKYSHSNNETMIPGYRIDSLYPEWGLAHRRRPPPPARLMTDNPTFGYCAWLHGDGHLWGAHLRLAGRRQGYNQERCFRTTPSSRTLRAARTTWGRRAWQRCAPFSARCATHDISSETRSLSKAPIHGQGTVVC